MQFKVAIVDDEAPVRQSIESCLTHENEFLCVGSYKNGIEALQGISKARPHIAIMDIGMPGMSGIECTRRLRIIQPKLRILMYTGRSDTQSLLRSLMAGCDGYLIKGEASTALLNGLLDLANGGAAFSLGCLRELLRCFQRWRDDADAQLLSPREEEVLSYLFQDFRHKEIAAELGVSLKTVRTHVWHIQQKLNASGHGDAVRRYLGLS